MSEIKIASVSMDDANELWLEYYTGNLQHRIMVSDVAKLHAEYTRVIIANAEVAELNTDLQEQLAASSESNVALVNGNEILQGVIAVAREALEKIARRGMVFDAKGTWSKEVNEIATTTLAKLDALK